MSSLDGCCGIGASAPRRHFIGTRNRPGMVIEHDDHSLWAAVKTMAVKPGKGPAYSQSS
jgi:hypothetical protein